MILEPASLGSPAPDQLNRNLRDGTLGFSVFLKRCESGENPFWELMSDLKITILRGSPGGMRQFLLLTTTNAQGTASSSLGECKPLLTVRSLLPLQTLQDFTTLRLSQSFF